MEFNDEELLIIEGALQGDVSDLAISITDKIFDYFHPTGLHRFPKGSPEFMAEVKRIKSEGSNPQ